MRRHPLSACGSTLVREQRQQRRTARRTSSSTWPSRYTARMQADRLALGTMLTCRKGTANRTQQQLELEIENLGAHLNAYTSVCRVTPLSSENITSDNSPAREHRILRQGPQRGRAPMCRHPRRYPPELQARGIRYRARTRRHPARV